MSALAFLLLMLCLIGLIALLYYGILCYPVIAQKSKPPNYDVEKRYLLPLPADLNDNNEASPTAPVAVAAAEPEAKEKHSLDESYPSVPNSSQSPREDDSFGSADVSQDIAGNTQLLDEPDCANVPGVRIDNYPLNQGKEQSRSDSGESLPLLHGDDEEDGLVLCQPNARSKHAGEPTPPMETDERPPSGRPTDVLRHEDLQRESNLQAVSVPVDVQTDPSSVTQLPDHVTVTISEPIKVPPQENMSTSHPASHVIVTIPQPLNAPPLMVAPVYDEPSIDQSPASLQKPLHSIVVPVSLMAPIELETYQETNIPHKSDAYGWKDEIGMAEVSKTEPDQLLETVQPQQLSHEELRENESSPEPHVTLTTAMLPSTASGVRPVSPDASNENCCDSSNTSSNASPEVSPRFKGSCTLSESSEPDLKEYTFNSECPCPSINTVLENEISSVSNVQILRYTKIDDSIVLESDASINDSMKVLVGDPVDLDDLQAESLKDSDTPGKVTPEPNEEFSTAVGPRCRTPDLAIARRSPDGDSMNSSEGENTSGDAPHGKEGETSVDDAPQKERGQGETSVDDAPQKERGQGETSVDGSTQKERGQGGTVVNDAPQKTSD